MTEFFDNMNFLINLSFFRASKLLFSLYFLMVKRHSEIGIRG